MSATVAPPKGLEFLPVLEKKFGEKVGPLGGLAGDVPTLVTDAASLRETALFLRDDPAAAFDLFLDLASADLSRLPGPQAPKAGERFQANYILYSTKRNEHLRLKVNLAAREPSVPTLTDVWPAANWFEREAWDLMGIDFKGHPNQKRLLTHGGFVGHALRKDYDPKQRWLCTEEDLLQTELAAQTDEPADMFETTTLNFGPSQPATHGTLRIVMRLDGETIVGAESECGYLHRCFEKMSEEHTYSQVFPYTDRLNYCSPMLNNNGYARAIESMLGVTPPPRALAVRTILGEFSRVMDHLVCLAANLVDIGGLTNFWYLFQPREEIYGLLEACSGARLTVSYGRVGGLANDVPENFVSWSREIIKGTRARIADVETLVTRNKIVWKRFRDTGVVTKEQALAWGWTGPCLRASGVPFDLRKDQPYEWYGEVDFDVPIMTEGDNYARYLVRIEEMKQSLRIIEQILDKLPGGPVRSDDYRVILPPKEMVYNEMEALIYHFKLVFEGVKVPPGEIYSATEGANGELGFTVISDGSGFPYRIKVRPPCFPLFASFEKIIKGHPVADAVATLGLLNIIAGELDR